MISRIRFNATLSAVAAGRPRLPRRTKRRRRRRDVDDDVRTSNRGTDRPTDRTVTDRPTYRTDRTDESPGPDRTTNETTDGYGTVRTNRPPYHRRPTTPEPPVRRTLRVRHGNAVTTTYENETTDLYRST